MIKLVDLLKEAKAFTATSKETGNVSVFKTKASRDAAIKAGTHEKRKSDKDGAVNVPGGDDKPKVNIFKRDSDRDSKERLKKMKKDREEKEFNSLYYSDAFDEKVDSLKDKMSDEDFKQIKDAIENLKYMQYDLEDIDKDEDNEEWAMQSDSIDVEVEDLKGLIKQAISKDKEEPKKDEPKSEPSKPRPGNPQVNKSVRKKAQELGITPQKLGKEEYESRMSKAAVEALTDANFHSEARKLISILEDKPEWDSNPMNDPNKPKDVFSKEYDEWRKNTVFSSELYDSAEGTDEIAHTATNESGWEGETSVDAIAFDLKMNGSHKLAAKIQSIFNEKNESTTSIVDMIPESVIINEGTRSQVGIIDRSGKIASAYVHYDGYPSNMKPGLKKHMKNEKDVLNLIKQGGARGIYNDKDIEYYKSGKPTKGNLKDFEKYVDAADRNGMAEYVYLYNMKDKKWYFADVYGDKKLKKLF